MVPGPWNIQGNEINAFNNTLLSSTLMPPTLFIDTLCVNKGVDEKLLKGVDKAIFRLGIVLKHLGHDHEKKPRKKPWSTFRLKASALMAITIFFNSLALRNLDAISHRVSPI